MSPHRTQETAEIEPSEQNDDPFLFSKITTAFKRSTKESSPTFDKLRVSNKKFKRTQIYFSSDVFAAVVRVVRLNFSLNRLSKVHQSD